MKSWRSYKRESVFQIRLRWILAFNPNRKSAANEFGHAWEEIWHLKVYLINCKAYLKN